MRKDKYRLGLFLVPLFGACACAGAGGGSVAPGIANPEIARAVGKLEHVTDLNRNLSPEETMAGFQLLGADVWEDRESFVVLLKHKSFFVRHMAAKAVSGSIRKRQYVVPENDPFQELLLDLALSDPVVEVRTDAIEGLGELHANAACGTLVSLLDSPLPGSPKAMSSDKDMSGYRTALYLATKHLACPGTENFFKQPGYMDLKQIIEVYAKADPAKFFGDQTREEERADESLNHMDPVENFDEFLAYINHPSPVVRNRMAQSLVESKNPEALGPLLRIIESDPVIQVRDITIRALRRFGDKRACPTLRRLMKYKGLGENIPNTKNPVTPEKIHRNIEATMDKLECEPGGK